MNFRLLGLVALLALASGAASARGMVWQVGDADNTVYLAGSVHLLPPSAYPLPEAFQRAYENAAIVAFETDIGELQSSAAQTRLFQAARYPDGTGLDDHLDDALYARVANLLGEMGQSISAMRSFRPWFIAGMIEVQAFMAEDFRQDLGLDTHFHERAVEDDKAILPLETLDRHLAVLTEMPADMARDYLAATVENVAALSDAPAAVFDFWREGDTAGLAAYVEEQIDDTPALYERLLFSRNDDWMAHIEALLAGSDDAMVLVGTLHLVGERGLIEQLRAAGHRPERVE